MYEILLTLRTDRPTAIAASRVKDIPEIIYLILSLDIRNDVSQICGARSRPPQLSRRQRGYRKPVPTVTAGPPTDNQSPLQLHFRAEESGNEVRDVASEDGDTDANQNPGCQVDGKYRTKVSILV